MVESVGDVDGADLVVVAVKLWDTEDVARRLAASKLAGTPVLSLQNGVHKDTVLARHLPAGSLLGGACFISAFIEEPGVVRHNGTLQRMVFGARHPEQEPVARQLLQACAEAGVDAEVSEDVDRVIWEKYVFLVGLSATTTAARRPIGVVRSHERTRVLLRDVMAEAVAVARASGVALAEDFAERQLAFCDTLPADMTSSMHNDLEHGHRLELPWLSGEWPTSPPNSASPRPATARSPTSSPRTSTAPRPAPDRRAPRSAGQPAVARLRRTDDQKAAPMRVTPISPVTTSFTA